MSVVLISESDGHHGHQSVPVALQTAAFSHCIVQDEHLFINWNNQTKINSCYFPKIVEILVILFVFCRPSRVNYNELNNLLQLLCIEYPKELATAL